MYPPAHIEVPPNYLPEHPFDQGDHEVRDEILAPFPRTREAVQLHRSEYYAHITYMDAQIGRILDALEKSGQARNTYVIFTADHGLAVGQHGHGQAESLRSQHPHAADGGGSGDRARASCGSPGVSAQSVRDHVRAGRRAERRTRWSSRAWRIC